MHKVSYLDMNWLSHKINNEFFQKELHNIRGIVFDFGCGKRPYESDILSVAENYIGVDWSNTMHGLRADIVADLNGPLPIADNAADTVVSFQTMEHLFEPQVMLNEAYRILKSEGIIFLTVPFQWHVHESPYDYFRYTRHGLEYMFSKAGFAQITVRESTGFWAMWFLKLNYQTIKIIRGPNTFKWIVKSILVPFWFCNQVIAQVMDKIWAAPQETCGYIVTARKLCN